MVGHSNVLINYTLVHVVVSISYHCLSPHRSLNRIQYLGTESMSCNCDQCAPKLYSSKFNSHSVPLTFKLECMCIHVCSLWFKFCKVCYEMSHIDWSSATWLAVRDWNDQPSTINWSRVRDQNVSPSTIDRSSTCVRGWNVLPSTNEWPSGPPYFNVVEVFMCLKSHVWKIEEGFIDVV